MNEQIIKKYPVLSLEKQAELLEKATNGDSEARELLILSNQRLVNKIANKYTGRGVPFEDLIQEGNLGLINAIDKFDTSKGSKLATYAYWYIEGTIRRAVLTDGVLKPSERLLVAQQKIWAASEILKQELGRIPTIEELAEATRLSESEIKNAGLYDFNTVSLDYIVSSEDGDSEFSESIKAPSQNNSEKVSDAINYALSELPERERDVLKFLFRIENITSEQIQKKYNISHEMVRHIGVAALRKLRKPEIINKLRDMVGDYE